MLYSDAQYKEFVIFHVSFENTYRYLQVIGVNLEPGANFQNYDTPCLTGNIPLIFTEIARWRAALRLRNPATGDSSDEGQREDPVSHCKRSWSAISQIWQLLQ